MITSLTLRIIFSLNATLFITASPILLGLWVICIALAIACYIRISITSWLGLIIFIIYVGGLLVIFAYFVALTPNLLIEGLTSISLFAATSCITLIFFILHPLERLKIIISSSNLPIISFLNHSAFAVVILALVLFIALVAVVKLCSSFSSPLRPFN